MNFAKSADKNDSLYEERRENANGYGFGYNGADGCILTRAAEDKLDNAIKILAIAVSRPITKGRCSSLSE
jgi:hypothetical protein